MPIIIRNYQASFDLLRKDLEQVLEYIEPVDCNDKTFSHRTYGLLLRACTDFESLAKDTLIDKDPKYPKSPEKLNINDYRKLEPKLNLEPLDVDFLLWRPQPRRASPFRKWSVSPLQWYQDYNKVKHNRDAEFARANLGVVVEAMAGLFVLLAIVSEFNWGDCSWQRENGQYSFWRPPFCMYGPV